MKRIHAASPSHRHHAMQPLPALNLTGSNRLPHLFSRLLILGFFVVALVLLFAPWRQFVKGSGRVIAFDPLDRRVSVEALVSGRVKRIHVVEGQRVRSGELLAEIQDNDPNLLENLKSQRSIALGRIELVKSRVESLEAQVQGQLTAKDRALDSANQSIRAARIAAETAALDHARIASLFEKGLASRREHEQAILRRDSTTANFHGAEANLARTQSEFDAAIASVKASRDSARADIAKAQEELNSLDIRVNQNERQVVTAPRDGIVLQVPATDGSYLKPGDPICVIIPETESRFVEIWVDGNDMPLIQARHERDGRPIPGSQVRLTFEGWPAVQTLGWPQLAVGTFGGEVVFVDATDDGKGRFRVVVGPSDDLVDRGDGQGPLKVGWPDGNRWLRQGVRANAWFLLDEVPLWFEIWRQINGFPAIGDSLSEPAPTKKP